MEHLAGKFLATKSSPSLNLSILWVSIPFYGWKKLEPKEQTPILTTRKIFYTSHMEITFSRVWDMRLQCMLELALTAPPISGQWFCRRSEEYKQNYVLCSTPFRMNLLVDSLLSPFF